MMIFGMVYFIETLCHGSEIKIFICDKVVNEVIYSYGPLYDFYSCQASFMNLHVLSSSLAESSLVT